MKYEFSEHFDIKFSGITINEKDYLADIFKSLKISCFANEAKKEGI